jgi:hypothetical protein
VLSVMLRILALTGLALTTISAAHAEWTRTYVVEWYEPAMYYGAKTGVIDPGSDCPAGTNPEPNWTKVMLDAGYTPQETRWLLDPTHPFRPEGPSTSGQNQMAFRGAGRANVYSQPWLAKDPGLIGVTGKIGEGFDLDGNARTGFVSPDGKTRGIDNNFYKALGCWLTYRGPARQSQHAMGRNDEMREGEWTAVIVAHGEGNDPLNDEHVRVGIYNSQDPIVKDGAGQVARSYSFRIAPDARLEAIFDAQTRNGVIETRRPAAEIWLREASYARELQLLQAQARLTMKPDGTLTGMIGGYRPWLPIYRGWIDARGAVIEKLTWVQLPGVYYALKRCADYSPPGANGEKTHISFALRIDAVPAYVITPDASRLVGEVVSYKSIAPPPRVLRAIPSELGERVVDGIVKTKEGVILGGPNAVIPPPLSETIH